MSSQEPLSAPLAHPIVPPPRRRWFRSLLLGLLIFLCGFVVGGVAGLLVMRNQVLNFIRYPEMAAGKLAERMRRSLELDDQQTRRVEEILRTRQSGVLAIRTQAQPKLEAELDRLQEEIAQVLNETQKAKWLKTCQRERRTWLPPLPSPESIQGPATKK